MLPGFGAGLAARGLRAFPAAVMKLCRQRCQRTGFAPTARSVQQASQLPLHARSQAT
eukprot:COSAG06_NODE_38829_length_419_cov_1.093750_1_plen_56_part_10